MFLTRHLSCGFCGKSGDEVVRLVVGPKVAICNECVDKIRQMMEEGPRRATEGQSRPGMGRVLWAHLKARRRS